MVDLARIAEPAEWFLVFHRTSTSRLLSFIAFGELKHVSAFGYCAGFDAWIVYDVTWKGTRVRLVRNDAAGQQAIIDMTRGCDMLKIAHAGQLPSWSSRIGFYCVSSVKHLLGLRCVAITPTQLYRYLRKTGAMTICEHGSTPTATA